MTGSRWRRATAAVLFVVGMLAAGCGNVEPLTVPAREGDATPQLAAPEAGDPRGTVTVAYPDVPAAWHGVEGDDVAAIDLSSLWGLPFYRYGPDGVLRPGLVENVTLDTSGEDWVVEVELRPGEWSDGQPVGSADVVATIELLRAGPREAEFAVLEGVAAVDERTVRLEFAQPYARWPHLLSGAPGVLPAHVITGSGLAAYEDGVPVSGGWFRLDEVEPGRSARFVAHPDGPLGPPRLASVDVAFTPRYETALGLLDTGRVGVVAGHLALNPVGRAERLDDVVAAAPMGGTVVALEWNGDTDPAVRRSVSAIIDVSQLVEGLLAPNGEAATSPLPGVDGPWPAAGRSSPEQRQIGTLRLLLPRWHEVTGFTARALQSDASVLEGTFEIVSLETPAFVESARDEADVVLQIRRTGPRPPLARLADAVTPEIRAADAALSAEGGSAAEAFEQLQEDGRIRPLYQVGVAHVWARNLHNVRPSAWPGVIFWNAGEWQLDGS